VLDHDAVFDQWLSHCDHYTESRKKQLREARSKACVSGEYVLHEKDFTCSSFVKREFVETCKLPRLINSRSDKFKVCVAPFISMVEDVVYKLPWFVKHIPISQLPAKLSRLSDYNWIIETDYSSFEACFVPAYMQTVEIPLWKYMLANNPKILRIVLRSYQQYRAGKNQPRVNLMKNPEYVATSIGSRMSGEMWTSLANGFSNLMNVLFLSQLHGVPVDGFVEGDDGLFGMKTPFLNAAMFSELGFNIKMNYGNDLRHTSFCGNVFSPESMTIVVNPENIARLFWSCNATYIDAKTKVLQQLLRAKAMSLYCTGKYTPIAGPLAFKVLSLLGPGNYILDPTRRWWMSKINALFSENSNFDRVAIPYPNRYIYEEKYGIPVQDQLDLEAFIERAESLNDLQIPYSFMASPNPSNAHWK